MGERYVVVVTHNTGHGEISNPMMITSDIVRAVHTARNIERLGFQFYDSEVGVIVYRLIEDAVYRKSEFRWTLGNLSPRTLVFSRTHSDCRTARRAGYCWEEEWFDVKLWRKVDGRVSARGKK